MSSDIPPSPVRALANRYAMGEVEYREYIRERRRLIDAIVAGEIALPEKFEEAIVAVEQPAPEQTTAEIEGDSTIELPRSPQQSKRWWLIGDWRR